MSEHNNRSSLFACAATAFGFKSLFPEIFRPEGFDRAYILKGSCGSGKSTVIRRVAQECLKRGERYTTYACSFDPESFDGIVIEGKRVYIADGTSPHVTDPLYPGAVETVINMSRGLDSAEISKNRDKIIELCSKSRDAFSDAYSFLRAAYEMEKSICKVASDGFRTEKMQAAIGRLSRDLIPFGTGHVISKCLTRVYTKDGLYKSGAFFECAGKKCLVTDKIGTAHIFMRELLREAARKEQPALVSVSPLDFETVNAVYLPRVSMAFEVSDNRNSESDAFRIINMARFTCKDTLSISAKKLRFMKKCFTALTDGASESLATAYKFHSELEKIYSQKTDHTENDAATERIISEIFG